MASVRAATVTAAAASCKVRPYRAGDRPALYDICLRTGDAGGDARGQYADATLLGDVYLGGYLALAPGLAFVLAGPDDTPLGYAVGVADTLAFTTACAHHWWPKVRAHRPDPRHVPAAQRTPDQRLAARLHHPPGADARIAAAYPAHLHIDLLPEAQGRGLGRALLQRLLAALTDSGAAGVHLDVAAANERAVGFYRRLGFRTVAAHPDGQTMATPLPPPDG